MKKFLNIIICLIAVFAFSSNVFAKGNTTTTTNESSNETKVVNVYIFTKDGCSHCAEAKEFFAELSEDKTYGKMFNLVVIQVYDSEWNADEDNMAVMTEVAELFGDEVSGVPYIVIGNEYSVNGYAESLDDEIKKAIKTAYKNDEYEDVVAPLAAQYAAASATTEEEKKDDTVAIIIVMVVAIASIGLPIYFSRKK